MLCVGKGSSGWPEQEVQQGVSDGSGRSIDLHIHVLYTVLNLYICIHTCIHVIKCYMCVYIIWIMHTINYFAPSGLILRNPFRKIFPSSQHRCSLLLGVEYGLVAPEAKSESAGASLWDVLLGTGMLIYYECI